MRRLLAALLLWLGLAPGAWAAIAFDATSESGSSWSTSVGSITWTHTIGGGGDMVLVVDVVSYNSGSSSAVASITYDGVALSRVDGITGVAGSYGSDIESWVLAGPASGSHSVVVTMTGVTSDVAAYGNSYSGVSQGAPIDSHAASQDNSASLTFSPATTVVASGAWLTGAVMTQGGVAGVGAGTALRSAQFGNGNGTGSADSGGTVGTGSQALTYTVGATGTWPGAVTLSLAPASGGATPTSLPGIFPLIGGLVALPRRARRKAMLRVALTLVATLFGAAPAVAGLNVSCAQWPSAGQPAPAAANGLNCLQYSYDAASGAQAIDTAATGNYGYALYPQRWAPGYGTYPSADYSVGGGVLTMATDDMPGVALDTVGVINAATESSVGFATFTPPFYVAVTFAEDGSLSPGATLDTPTSLCPTVNGERTSWPAIWLEDITGIWEQTNCAGTTHFAEIDLFEAEGNAATLHDWTNPPWGGAAGDGGHSITGATFTASTFHTAATLTITAAAGGGTGSNTFYFDGAPIGTDTWTPGNTYSDTDSGHFVLMVSPGYSWAAYVKTIEAWRR